MEIALALVVVAAAYGAACAVWPLTGCPRCHGAGKLRSPTGRTWRACPRCHGSGARIRTGRRAWTWLTGTRRNARR